MWAELLRSDMHSVLQRDFQRVGFLPTLLSDYGDNGILSSQHGGSFKCSPDGKKQCERGWGGPLCNEPQCDQRCEHGTCTAPNTCRCGHFDLSSLHSKRQFFCLSDDTPAANASHTDETPRKTWRQEVCHIVVWRRNPGDSPLNTTEFLSDLWGWSF